MLSTGSGGYNGSPVNGLGKLVLSGAAAIAAAGLLVVLFVGARHRAQTAHCRNNLRQLGSLGIMNWKGLDPERTGRDFWQNVREVSYRIRGGRDDGKWKPPYAGAPAGTALALDPFLCPVLGTTVSRPESAAHIDFLGPRSLPEELKEVPPGRPIGADRPGNHPSGGHVLRLNTAVEAVSPIVEQAEADLGVLKD